jgi:hypothetical protein
MPRQPLAVSVAVLVMGAFALVSADVQTARVGRGRVVTEARCASDLGMGAKSGRRFCDVFVVATPVESVALSIPPHTGAATLRFDLHNRFLMSDTERTPAEAYERHAALVAIVSGTGEEIVRAAVTREYRTIEDLFDRITGGGREDGLKAVAPGSPEAVVAIIPDGMNAIGIVGISVERVSAAGRQIYDSPGRPVALASNFRIEYTPQ